MANVTQIPACCCRDGTDANKVLWVGGRSNFEGAMPGRMFLERPLTDVALALGIDDVPKSESPRRNISPGEDVIVCIPGHRFERMRWGMIPVGRVNARGRPVLETIINARSETVFDKTAFEGVGRAVVPADGWYEWTGKARRKEAWRIRPKSGELLLFAAITDVWEAPGGRFVHQVATVTCEPSADVRDVHHRMGVLIAADALETWLHGEEPQARDLMRPFPDGRLIVEPAEDVDWNGP